MSDDQAAGQAVISATGIIKHYEGGLIKALDGVNLTVRAGEFIAVCGPSGCGKSTLLNVISGVDRPDAGRIVVSGRNLTSLAPSALDGYRARVIGLVFQLHNLLPNLTALENVQVPMLSTRMPAAERVSWARELLARVGLDDREYARPPHTVGRRAPTRGDRAGAGKQARNPPGRRAHRRARFQEQ